MTQTTLADWLAWIERLHPSSIDLGLERTARVAQRLGVQDPGVPVFTVAGTNGKGSVCALLEAVMQAQGLRVGCYTSPHLERYNERVRVAGEHASDAALCAAFAEVEAARGQIPLTYFEFATLATLVHFARADVDALVLEVGLGGRLDATNVIDADVAVVTSVALDHAEWLGNDLAQIAYEKAGVARAGRPLVCGMRTPAPGLLEAVQALDAAPVVRGVDFDAQPGAPGAETWDWWGLGQQRPALPLPALVGGYQLDNAATAFAALAAYAWLPPVQVLATGLRSASIPARFECHRSDGVEVIFDVAHNPAAAAVLAATLSARPCSGRTYAVVGIYRDKDAGGVAGALAPAVDEWYAVTLTGERGR